MVAYEQRWSARATPGIHLLCTAYFHEDWMLDDASADDVVRRFCVSEAPNLVRQTAVDISRTLTSDISEAELALLVEHLGTNYWPQADGLSYRAWLSRILVHFPVAG